MSALTGGDITLLSEAELKEKVKDMSIYALTETLGNARTLAKNRPYFNTTKGLAKLKIIGEEIRVKAKLPAPEFLPRVGRKSRRNRRGGRRYTRRR